MCRIKQQNFVNKSRDIITPNSNSSINNIRHISNHNNKNSAPYRKIEKSPIYNENQSPQQYLTTNINTTTNTIKKEIDVIPTISFDDQRYLTSAAVKSKSRIIKLKNKEKNIKKLNLGSFTLRTNSFKNDVRERNNSSSNNRGNYYTERKHENLYMLVVKYC